MTPRRRAGFVRTNSSAIAAFSLVAVSPCVGMPALSCSGSLQPMQRIELMFGRNIHGHRRVGDAAWARFLAREITPRFPDGLTVLDAAGQWRNPTDGRIVREPSRLVIIVTADGASQVDDRVAAIVAAYKLRFRQKSVGVVTSPACAAF
jgi:Protein of unknown function (DUF3574)